MEHISKLISQTTATSTQNSSDPHVSDGIRAVFSMFRRNYGRLFETNYPDREALLKAMSIWTLKFGHVGNEKLKAATIQVMSNCEFVPRLADFNRALSEVRSDPSHKVFIALPKPKANPEKAKAELAKMRASLGSK